MEWSGEKEGGSDEKAVEWIKAANSFARKLRFKKRPAYWGL